MFLSEPKSQAQFRPVCCQGCGELWVKAADPLGALCNDFWFRLLEGLLQLGVPEEGDSRWWKAAMMGAAAKLKEI